MTSSNKAQSALEYLNTYGWAILVVLVVGLVLWQMGIFGSHADVNRAVGFGKITVLEPTIKYMEKSGTPEQQVTNNLNFTVVNAAGTHIHGLGIGTNGDCNSSVLSCSGGVTLSKTSLAPDEITEISKICCKNWESGDFFWVNVTFTYWYRVAEMKVNRTERGIIQGFVEEET